MVSHSLALIERICEEVIWLEKGKVVEKGPSKEVVKNYKIKNKII